MSAADLLAHLADEAAATHHCPSIAWGLVLDGSLVASGGVGTLDDGAAPDHHTVYRIASMTKSFTTAAVLGLRDDGALSLDVPVAQYAPELAGVSGPAGSAPVTLRRLLSMTAGMATDDAWADRHLDMTPDEIDRIYAGGPFFARLPDDGYEYSNLGFGMIGRTVLAATGTRVQDHVSNRLLGPLGMSNTRWLEPTDLRWARPHRTQDDAIVPDLPHPIGDGEIAPMGGLWTTVADLATWVAWLDGANTEVHQPDAVGLSAASRREMQRMHTYAGVTTVAGRTSPSGYGFGLNLRDDADLGMVIAHSGGLPGYGTNMRWLKGRGVGVIALANTTYAPMGALTLRMLAEMHHEAMLPPRPKVAAPVLEAAAHRLVALLNHWDDAAATALFSDNVALDDSFERRAAAAARLVGEHGPLRVLGVRGASWGSGTIDVQGNGAPFTITIELAPLPTQTEGFVQLYSAQKPR
jgi:CubicO group peptidase (beta-lactamase class C family)